MKKVVGRADWDMEEDHLKKEATIINSPTTTITFMVMDTTDEEAMRLHLTTTREVKKKSQNLSKILS